MPSSWLTSGLTAKLLAEWNIAEEAGETDGAAIVQMDDTGGSGLHGTQATAGNRAIYRANRLNGLGAAEFVSADLYSSTLSAANLGQSYIAVVRVDTFAAFPAMLGPSAGGGRLWRFTSSGQLQFVRSGVVNIGNSVQVAPLNVPIIIFSSVDNGAQVYAINGNRETAAAASAAFSASTTVIGGDITGSFDGDIFYLAALSTLTQSEQEEYEGLLADLFGIPLVMGHAQRRATRFYLPSTGTPAISPTPKAEWEENPSLTRLPMVTTRGSSALTTLTVSESSSAVANRDILIAQFISEPLAAGSFGGVVKSLVRARESNAGLNARTQFILRVLSGDGATDRGDLYAGDATTQTGNPTSELATTMFSRRFPRGAGWRGDKLTWNDGDRVVAEYGVREHNTVATIYNAELRVGENAATAVPENETATTDDHPWLDIGFAFTPYSPPAGDEPRRRNAGMVG